MSSIPVRFPELWEIKANEFRRAQSLGYILFHQSRGSFVEHKEPRVHLIPSLFLFKKNKIKVRLKYLFDS